MENYFTENDRRLVFLHVPKTAGTTVTKVLASQFSKDDIAPVANAQELAQLDDEQLLQYRFFAGHFDPGRFRALPGESQFITVLRDPWQRVLSHIFFWKQQAAIYSDAERPPHLQALLSMPMDEFLSSTDERIATPRTNQLENIYTHYYGLGTFFYSSKIDNMRSSADYDPSQLVRDALHRLTNFFAVTGFTDTLQSLFVALNQLYGLDIPLDASDSRAQVNQTLKGRNKKDELLSLPGGERAFEILSDMVATDVELFERFEQRARCYVSPSQFSAN